VPSEVSIPLHSFVPRGYVVDHLCMAAAFLLAIFFLAGLSRPSSVGKVASCRELSPKKGAANAGPLRSE
jgi:hypothetical protein